MLIEKIGRGTLFTFEKEDALLEGVSVYLIETDDRLILCDTHLGKNSMQRILEFITNQGIGHKELIIFNTHHDWDHVWGNGAFKDHVILASQKCKELMLDVATYELDKLSRFNDGSAEILYPNQTFTDHYTIGDIEFIAMPGHTAGCAIVIDHQTSVAFIGDLVEAPNPHLAYEHLDEYIDTLKRIKNMNIKTYITSHSQVVSEAIIDQNMDYITWVRDNKEQLKTDPEKGWIIKYLLISEFQSKLKEKGLYVNEKSFREKLWSALNYDIRHLDKEFEYIREVQYEDLEEALINLA